ncbi:MAG: dihydroorotate dehydrogenase electron transfer subunit [Candidatus Omnitrophota bacterium]
MFQIKAKVLYNKRDKDSFFHCAMEAPRIALKALPGQFVNIRLTDAFEPLLRRPFSIHRVRGKTVEIIYEVLGKGTQAFSRKKAGEYLDVIGPLGNGFGHPPTPIPHSPSILVAGGMGVAPLVFLAEKLREIQNPCLSGRQAKSKIQNLVFIGAKTKKQVLCEKEFKKLGCEVKIATDDGSKGFKGRVSGLLKLLLCTMHHACLPARQAPCTIYACGPRPMLKEIALISAQYHIPAQVSLEEHMACGIGACLGCVVKAKGKKPKAKSDFEYKRVCKEGPVFRADEIVWE